MKSLNLYEMKKVEIVVEGQHQEFVTDLLDKAGVPGYTIFHNLSGKGSHGFHESHLLFNEEETLIMIVSVMNEEKLEAILEALRPFFNENSGVVFVSDVKVSRLEKFNR